MYRIKKEEQLYKFEEIKHIHFEPTQRCQAACPMCDRTNNPHIKNAELSIEQFKQIVKQAMPLHYKNFCVTNA